MWREEKIQNTVLFIYKLFCVFCLLPIYCSVRLLCFYSESQAKWNWYQRARSLYRFVISLIRAELICVVELLLCGDWAIYEFGMYLCWIEGTQTLSYVHNAESTNVTYVIVSSSYSTAKCSIRNTSTFMDVHFFKHTAAGKSLCFPEKVIEHENVISTRSLFQLDDLQAFCRLQSIPHRDVWRFK